MNKDAKEIKRLFIALETEMIIPELTEARKATKKIYEIINGLDLQSEIEYLNNIISGIDYEGKPIGELSSEGNEHLNQAAEAFLKLNGLVEEEIKALRAQEGGAPVPKAPVSEEDVGRVVEEEKEAPAEEKKEKKEEK